MATSFRSDAAILGGQLIGGTPATDLYISPSGNDDNNGLTSLTPIRTWGRLFNLIPATVPILATINVHMAAGNYARLNIPPSFALAYASYLKFICETETVFTGAADGWVGGTDQLAFTGAAPGWTPNALTRCFLVSSDFDPTSPSPYTAGSKVFPIRSNTGDTLTLAVNKPIAAMTGPFRVLRSLCYIDSTGQPASPPDIVVNATGTGSVAFFFLISRNPRSAFSIYRASASVYLVGCGVDSPANSSPFSISNTIGFVYLLGCWAYRAGYVFANTESPNVILYRCWAVGPIPIAGSGLELSGRNSRTSISGGLRIDGIAVPVQIKEGARLYSYWVDQSNAILGTGNGSGPFFSLYNVPGTILSIGGGMTGNPFDVPSNGVIGAPFGRRTLDDPSEVDYGSGVYWRKNDAAAIAPGPVTVTIPNIDLKDGGATDYSAIVPGAAARFLVSAVYAELTAASGLNADAQIQVGTSFGGTEVVTNAGGMLSGLTATGVNKNLALTSPQGMVGGAWTLHVKVTTPDSGTSGTLKLRVVGYTTN